MISDLSTSPSTDDDRGFGWGPSHSDEEDTLFTDFFGESSKIDSPWTWIADSFNFFRCGASEPILVEDGPFPYSMDEEDDLFAHGPCNANVFRGPKSVKNGRDDDAATPRATATDSFATPRSGTICTANDVSLNSILGSHHPPQPTHRVWSSPPRLHNMATSHKGRSGRHQSVPKILNEAYYFSDMDTFLSDEFTDMEQGYFNGLYDQICSPSKTRQDTKIDAIPSAYTAEPRSVLLSFDDTISKLTMEDQRSCSTETLDALDRRATIAAIVRAQARGGWRAMAQEEAEAKAEELSRFGIEHTFTESRLAPEEQAPFTESRLSLFGIERTFTESRLSPPNVPSDGASVDRHQVIRKFNDETQEFQKFQPNFFSSESTTQSDTEERETIDDPKTKTSAPTKSRFLRPFHRKKKKDSKQGKGKHGKRSSFLKALTPPRKIKHTENTSTPTSTTGLSTTDTTSSYAEKGFQDNYAFIESDETREIASIPQRDAPKETPTVIEEVEVLERRKEPVYSSYIRSPSYNVVEDVEILRKASDISNLKHFQPGYHQEQVVNNDEDHLFEAGAGEGRGSRGHDPAESTSTQFESEMTSSSVDELGFPTDEGHDEQDPTDTSSSIGPTFRTMTSRLAKERVDSQQLRLMLEKKDEDLGQLRELLHSNESKTVLERVNSSSKANPLVQ
ncbi:expressed unknown protein [Seminavis robusta]|uniref:Uncharacterized protein n=1 Tax=Seminavis robusta TaxID=568900 RepID=A0A9N8HK75_9STRA|nr:expressed unknown protein [Seminavis robusta]|eukprot:Sro711_g191240.1 n/a (677) ;mRNA; r:38794-40824